MIIMLPSASLCITWLSWIKKSIQCLSFFLADFLLNHLPCTHVALTAWLL
jgi:hypothetical protein